MTMFQIHVYVRDPASGLSWWRALRPSGCERPYTYPTRAEAERIMNMCYPNADAASVKVIEE